MPEHIVPMLARLSKELPPREDEYGFEIKWDGIRAVVYSGEHDVRIENRNLRDITFKYPELHAMAGLNAVLDGEIVALDEHGRPSFELMQARMHLSSEAVVARRMADVPARFMAFDLLWHDGRDLMPLPYTERRAALEALDVNGPSWQTPFWRPGEGSELLEAAKAQDLEGVIAKRLDSPYCPGKRTSHWLKVKSKMSQELVVAGWLPGEGRRERTLGALLVGHYDGGELRYAGRVGTGFKERDLDMLMDLLPPLRQSSSPFAGALQPPRQAIFVEPKLVAEVEFTEWTREGILRHPAYKGLRDDKRPQDVVRERPA